MSSGGGAGPLIATFHGFVHNTMDGLMLFEACLSGKLHHVPRRPHDRERSTLIKSGSIFIYEENASGIKRWTDGVAWSPSRILGNFLIYRELEKPFPPGEKKRAMKRKRSSVPGEPYPRRHSDPAEPSEHQTPLTPPTPNVSGEVKPDIAGSDQDRELERSLIGSLVDSYGFRPDGLVKKTMSVSVNGISHHMVSYYKVEDVKNNRLPRPISDARLANIAVRPELYLKQNFRAPVEENEQYALDGHLHGHPQAMYSMGPGGYGGVRPGQYFGGHQYSNMPYMQSSAAASYGGMTNSSWPPPPPQHPQHQQQHQPSSTSMGYASHPAYAEQPYTGYYKSSTPHSAASVTKTEDSQSHSQPLSYGTQYPPTYPTMQRNGSIGSQSHVLQSGYHTPAPPPPPSTFGSMAARPPPYNPQPSSSAQQSSQAYGSAPGSAQPYAVRSPPQSYSMHSAPPQQSPHQSVRSPISAGGPNSTTTPNPSSSGGPQQHQPSDSSHGHMPYRSSSYGGSGAGGGGGGASSHHSSQQHHASGADVSGLGISNSAAYPPANSQPSHAYQSYGAPSSQPYRSVGGVSHYAQ